MVLLKVYIGKPAARVVLQSGRVGLVEWVDEPQKTILCLMDGGPPTAEEVPVWHIKEMGDVQSPL